MAKLGVFALVLALAIAAYGLVASVVGARRDRPVLVESARTAAYSLFALVLAACLIMVVALLRNDFAIQYVAENSSRETPAFFKVLALWGADQGSLLLWNLILSGYVAAVAFRFRRRRSVEFPWAMAVLFLVQAFYLSLVMGPTTPFATFAVAPPDGQGPVALLQNDPLMAVHPPFLYLGFIGFSVPFAFAVAALITGNVTDRWIRLVRRWTLIPWVFLTIGLTLGALWSYAVLGWGGYWAWDPVENVALLPWLMATAFLHSVMLQERRGMLKVWNLSMVVGAFALTTFATFLTRGSILASVHAFAASPVGPLLLAFLVLILVGGFGLVAVRSWRLASEGRFDSALSRETAFLGNNLALLGLMFAILVGTIFPLLVQALQNRQVTVGAPYFDQTGVPVVLLLMFLMAVGPLLAWRRTSPERFRRRAAVPVALAALTMVVLVALRLRDAPSLLAYGLAGFVIAANGAEIVRGVRSFARGRGASAIASLPAAVVGRRRHYGGHVVHIGFAILAIAVTTSSVFRLSTEVTLRQGHAATFAGYTLRYEGQRILEQPQRRVLLAEVAVSRTAGGASLGTVHPSMNLYPTSSDPVGTPSIDYGVLRDFYASVIAFSADGRQATFRFFLDPGVMWLWIGAGVMAAGGLLALWPARRMRAPAVARTKETPSLVEARA